jgi:hypothetical protein
MKIPKLIPALKISPITLQEVNIKEIKSAIAIVILFFIYLLCFVQIMNVI